MTLTMSHHQLDAMYRRHLRLCGWSWSVVLSLMDPLDDINWCEETPGHSGQHHSYAALNCMKKEERVGDGLACALL